MAELIVALDVSSTQEVERIVDRLGDAVSFYKIGLELFSAEGPDVVKAVKRRGKKVFLDLKLHDIPRTVERAVKSGAALGVDLMTLHAAGGKAMIRAAKDAALACGPKAPKILAVTVLTSLDQSDLADLGVTRDMKAQVEALGRLACSNGADGIVCSPKEVAAMRAALGPAALLVTPGVRPAGAAVGDQKRVATPGQAVKDGSTHLVVGRPILEAADPCAAALAIAVEMAGA
jgi:orotidine-5'-phosphate decarboxylase